jgi:hypothetical protein
MASTPDVEAYVNASQNDCNPGGNGNGQAYPGLEEHSTSECNVPFSSGRLAFDGRDALRVGRQQEGPATRYCSGSCRCVAST